MLARMLKKVLGRTIGQSRPLSSSHEAATPPTLKQQGDEALNAADLPEAERLYRLAIASAPLDARAQFMLGYVLREQEQYDAAATALNHALAIEPQLADAHYVLGSMHQAAGRYPAAVEHFREAMALDPGNAYVYRDLCLTYVDAGQLDPALAVVERGIARDPESAELHLMVGNIRDLQCRYAEALAAYERALAIAPESAQVHSNRGLLLTDLGRYDEALESYAQALRLQPDYDNAHYNEGLCRLVLGQLEIGWEKHEHRWKSPTFRQTQGLYGQREFARPLWLGESSLVGRTILLHPEQGLGDTIQFSRYAQVLSAMGADVVMEVQPALRRLLSDVPGVSQVVAVGDAWPEHDLHCPLMSLPLSCRTTLQNIPAADGYLGTSPKHHARVRHWQAKLGKRTKPRIGVVWSGSKTHKNDANRSIRWAEFSQLVTQRHEFVCLQNEIRESDLASLAARSDVRRFTQDLIDFTETAALIANLDLVVCVDTSVAHLAGALGKPVWVLLPANPDWRWMLQREDTPWYSRMRLFRQRALDSWPEVIARVHSELEVLEGSPADQAFLDSRV